MATGDPVGFVQAHFQYNLESDPEPMFTQLAFAVDVDYDETNSQNILDAWSAAMIDLTTLQYTIGPGYVEQFLDGVPPNIHPGIITRAGTVSNDASPQNTAYLVRKSGGPPGKGNTGRMYIPGVPESFVDALGLVDSSARIALQTALEDFFTAIVTTESVIQGALVHQPPPRFIPGPRIDNPAYPGTIQFTPISVLQVQFQAATQRRRMRP